MTRQALGVDAASLDCVLRGHDLTSSRTPRRKLLVPGDRYPDRIELTTSHRLLLLDADDVGVARLRKRWRGLIDVDQSTGTGPRMTGLVLVRPDGHIGFRARIATPAALAAVDAHLESYLVGA